MPQLMPLNWLFSLLMVGFLMIVGYYLYCLKIEMRLEILNDVNIGNNLIWLW